MITCSGRLSISSADSTQHWVWDWVGRTQTTKQIGCRDDAGALLSVDYNRQPLFDLSQWRAHQPSDSTHSWPSAPPPPRAGPHLRRCQVVLEVLCGRLEVAGSVARARCALSDTPSFRGSSDYKCPAAYLNPAQGMRPSSNRESRTVTAAFATRRYAWTGIAAWGKTCCLEPNMGQKLRS